MNRRRNIFFILSVPLLLLAFILSITLGAVNIPFAEIFKSIFDNGNDINNVLITDIRLPRTLVAAFVGIALSLSGATLQGVMNNSLASPNIIGVSSGAGLVAALVLVIFPDNLYLLTPLSFIGALIAAVIVYLIAWNGKMEPLRLILSGVAVSSVISAIISAIMIFFPDRVDGVINFMVGGLSTTGWSQFNLLWPYVIFSLVALFIYSNKLNILMLGDDNARSLGVNVELTKIFFIAIASLLAASSVSVVGLLGFVGLIVPHAARLIVGVNYNYLFPASALLGAITLVICDTLARVLFAPIELPAGIIMALLGGPFFLYLLRKEK